MIQFNVGGIPHTKQLISLEYQDWHKALCYEYKNAIIARVATLMFDMLQFNVGGIPHTKQLISLEYKDQHMALCYKYKNAIVAKGWCLLCYNSMLVVFLILSSWFHWSIKTNTRHYVVNTRISSLQEVDAG